MPTGTNGPETDGLHELGRSGRACPECGSENIELIEGAYATGVTAPDGGEERRHVRAVRCRDCGEYEEF